MTTSKLLRLFFFYILLPLPVFILPVPAFAEQGDFIKWHSTNIQLLRGWDYELGADERTLATFEHANGWSHGDFYMFIDYTWPDQGSSYGYAEFSPRFSLSKMTGHKFSNGIIKDVLISATIEKPEHKDARYLYGGAVDLNLSGFKYFKTNLYVRDNPDLQGRTWQVTLAWNRPIKTDNGSWLIEGFADFAGNEGNKESYQLIVPRFLFDISNIIGVKNDTLWLGIEWQYWHNKFGVDGITESVPQLQVKWVF